MGKPKEMPSVAATTEGKPSFHVNRFGSPHIGQSSRTDKAGSIQISRHAVERLVQSAIDLLDHADGDTDLEADGSEESFAPVQHYRERAGCPIADPGGCQHDGREPEDAL